MTKVFLGLNQVAINYCTDIYKPQLLKQFRINQYTMGYKSELVKYCINNQQVRMYKIIPNTVLHQEYNVALTKTLCINQTTRMYLTMYRNSIQLLLSILKMSRKNICKHSITLQVEYNISDLLLYVILLTIITIVNVSDVPGHKQSQHNIK